MMDLAAIRFDLAACAATAGFSTFDFAPDDVADLPAAVVGPPREVEALTITRWRVQLPVRLFVSSADAQDAARTLDRALSADVPDSDPISFLDAIRAANSTSSSWSTVRFVTSETNRVQMPGGSVAWSADITLEVTTP